MDNTFYKGNLTIKATTEQQISLTLNTPETQNKNIIEQHMEQTPWELQTTNKNKTTFHYTLNHEQTPYHEKTLTTLTQHGITINGEYYNDNIEYQNIKIIRNNKQTNQYEEKSIQEYPQTHYYKIEQTNTIYKILKTITQTNPTATINTEQLHKLYTNLSTNTETLKNTKQTIQTIHQNGFPHANPQQIAKTLQTYQTLTQTYTPQTINNIPTVTQPVKGTISITTNPHTNNKLKKHTKKPHNQNITETLLNQNNITTKTTITTGTNKTLTLTHATFQNYTWTEQLNKTITTIIKNNGWVEGTIKDAENKTWIFTKTTGKQQWHTEQTIHAIRDETNIKTNKNYLLEYLTIKIQYHPEKTIKTKTLKQIFNLIEKEAHNWDSFQSYETTTNKINKKLQTIKNLKNPPIK